MFCSTVQERQQESLPADINNTLDRENAEDIAAEESDSDLPKPPEIHCISFRTRLISYASRMLNVCKEVVLMLAIVLTYAALPNK